jgi:predicted RNA-binding protein associated with RNAse of E/G family
VDEVRVVFSKWPDLPHWEYDARRLGTDRHGTWLGVPVGTRIARPGAAFHTGSTQVVLVPDAPFVATFYSAPGEAGLPCEVYVDISTQPVLTNGVVRAFDLDLDVIRGWSGRTWVDDEDEFAEHRMTLQYPDDLVTTALASCAKVLQDVGARVPPYDGVTSDRWMSVLDG